MKNHWKNQEVILTKLLISHLIIPLEYLTWYQIIAKTLYSHLMAGYKRNLIWLFVNFNENIKNKWKYFGKIKG